MGADGLEHGEARLAERILSRLEEARVGQRGQAAERLRGEDRRVVRHGDVEVRCVDRAGDSAAADAPNEPAKAPSRTKSSRRSGSSRPTDQAMERSSVRWRSGTSSRHAVDGRFRSTSRRISSIGRVRACEAASSIARGSPSSRLQMCADCVVVRGPQQGARCLRAIAEERPRLAGPGPAARRGPGARHEGRVGSGSWPGSAARERDGKQPADERRRPRGPAPSCRGPGATAGRPVATKRVLGGLVGPGGDVEGRRDRGPTRPPGRSPTASSTRNTPPGKSASSERAASTASRVLPVPPGPSRVTSRWLRRAAAISAISRPPADEARQLGRQVGRRGGGAAQGTVVGRQAVDVELEDLDRLGEVPEAVRAAGAQAEPGGQGARRPPPRRRSTASGPRARAPGGGRSGRAAPRSSGRRAARPRPARRPGGPGRRRRGSSPRRPSPAGWRPRPRGRRPGRRRRRRRRRRRSRTRRPGGRRPRRRGARGGGPGPRPRPRGRARAAAWSPPRR